MGSYNPTCGVTQLPILWKQPIRCFLIAFDPDPLSWHAPHTGHFDTTDIAWPIAPGLKCVYDDYGLPENIQVPPVAGLLIDNLFPERLVPDLLKEAERGTLTCAYGMKQTAKVGLWMVHEAVYQHLIHNIHQEETWRAEREGSLEVLVAGGRQYVNHMAALGRAVTQAKAAKDMEALSRASARMFSMRRDETLENNVFVNRLDQNQGNLGWMRMPYIEHIQHLAMKGGLETAEALEQAYAFTDALAELLRFNDAMCTLRKSIVPQTGLGSQARNAMAYVSLAEVTAGLARGMENYDPDFQDGDDPDEDDEPGEHADAPQP